MTLTVFVRSQNPPPGEDPDKEEFPSLCFDQGHVSIGRVEGCDIWLPDAKVSPAHASVVRDKDGTYWIVDEGSEDGTYVADARLPSHRRHRIDHGDQVRVGSFRLELCMGRDVLPSRPMATRDLALAIVQQALDAVGRQREPSVVATRGKDVGKRLHLPNNHEVRIIGRGIDTHLVLDDLDASRRHVQVVRRGDAVWVRDLGSKNGTLLDGKRLAPNEDTLWPVGGRLRFSSNVFVCEDPIADAIAALDRQAAEINAPDDAPMAFSSTPPPTSSAPASTSSKKADGAVLAVAVGRGGGGGPLVAPLPVGNPVQRVAQRWRQKGVGGDLVIGLVVLIVLALCGAAVWVLFQG